MIKYRYSEELEIATYYAKKLHDDAVLSILKNGTVENSADAVRLSEFFWNMVDASIIDEQKDVALPWPEGAEYWNEKIMTSISGYLENAGYGSEWESISDKQ
ncbi:hypothetical protein [Teredinibacter sp. KSP-S5-2]|uniref:hypothetical protein n=1 Tax=Teredinibacter sp. KSP-S5-2 TaxID=3034506 RepID=UPI002934561F|nr:hypothetical protein [Teredinibacter sp. KSP-S5-2]WNO10600.1 hypothetical protein P5V12_05375 [Teredinibacter sp. KSP-S5-2]